MITREGKASLTWSVDLGGVDFGDSDNHGVEGFGGQALEILEKRVDIAN